MRRLNLTFLAILLVVLVLLGGAVYSVHEVQVVRNASALLDRARVAAEKKQHHKAQEAMTWYLSLRPDDKDAWARYAEMVDTADGSRTRVEKSYLVHQEALRHRLEDRKLRRRCADLAMELGRHADALGLFKELLPPELQERASQQTPPKELLNRSAAERADWAELEDLAGQCEQRNGQPNEARGRYDLAIALDPQRVDAYDRLARLLATDLRDPAQARETIKAMIANNPNSGRAYAFRWRLARDLWPQDVVDADVSRALELTPDDREVLLAAAMVSELKRDSAAMRGYLERGFRSDAKDFLFAISLARLEMREEHPDRAETVLRRAFEARPLVGLAFELADALVAQRKFEGKGNADELITLLRQFGLGDTRVRFLEAEALFLKTVADSEPQKNWKKVVDELETVRVILASDPDLRVRINLMLAECHGRLGRQEQRLEALRLAAADDQGTGLAAAEEVRALLQTGKLKEAAKAVSRLAVAGNDPQWQIELARLQLQRVVRQPSAQRKWQEVETLLARAERAIGAADERVRSLRLDVLAAQDRLADAAGLLRQWLASEPRNLVYRLAMARLKQRQGRIDEALRDIDQAEKDLGASPTIDLARLDYWSQRGGTAGRAEVARLAERRGQISAADRPGFLERLGTVAIRFGRPDLARRYWHELASLQPANTDVRLGLFDLAMIAGDREDAERLVTEISKIQGKDGISWRFARAAFLLDRARRGDAAGLTEAKNLASAIEQDDPNGWIAPTLKGQIAELTGSADQAIKDYTVALERGNIQPSFARQLVRLLDQRGRRDEARHVVEVLGNQGASVTEVTIAQILDAIRRREYDAAIRMANELYPDRSQSSSDHFNLGWIYQAAGRMNEAGQHFGLAVKLGPGVPENWLGYVRYLVAARQPDRARTAIEEAGKALPPERAALTQAQCALALGDTKGAEALITQAMAVPGQTDDPGALRIAVDVNVRLKRLDDARKYLDLIAAASSTSAYDQSWANRARASIIGAASRPADREKALALLDANLSRAPGDVEDQTLKAVILATMPDRRREAVAILQQLAATNRLADESRFLLARLYLDQGQADRYESAMLELLNRQDRDPRHLAQFVDHLIGANKLEQAGRWLDALEQADPRALAALELRARLLDARKRHPELLALLQARGRDVPDQIGVVADLLSRFGFAREAEAAYKAFVARDPARPERTLALGVFLARQDRTAEALEIFTRARTTCPPEQVTAAALPLLEAPSASEAQKRQVEAWLAEAVKKRPEAVHLTTALGVVWIRAGRFHDAESLYRGILAANPDDVDALNALAWLLVMRDSPNPDEALGLITRAVDRAGPMATLMDTRAVVLIRAGRLDQAIEQLSDAARRAPRNPSVPLHLAWALEAQGKREDARREFQKAEGLGLKDQSLDPYERATVKKLRAELFPG